LTGGTIVRFSVPNTVAAQQLPGEHVGDGDQQHRHAEFLVVVEQVAYRSRQVADGRPVPLAADALGLAFGGGGQQPLLAPEPADHRL
jgi:hypothetical protein